MLGGKTLAFPRSGMAHGDYVLVDPGLDVVHVTRGALSYFKKPGPAPGTNNVLRLVRRALLRDLRLALRTVLATHSPFLQHGIVLDLDGRPRTLSLGVKPILYRGERHYLVTVEGAGEKGSG